jgi:hypothetical protein
MLGVSKIQVWSIVDGFDRSVSVEVDDEVLSMSEEQKRRRWSGEMRIKAVSYSAGDRVEPFPSREVAFVSHHNDIQTSFINLMKTTCTDIPTHITMMSVICCRSAHCYQSDTLVDPSFSVCHSRVPRKFDSFPHCLFVFSFIVSISSWLNASESSPSWTESYRKVVD